MSISRRREALLLFLGDIFFLSLALFTAIVVRYSDLPSLYYLSIHFLPFSFLFLTSTVVFFIAGLYEKHTLTMKSALPLTVLYAQAANTIIAAAFFFFVPFFVIQPKAFLFIYLVVSVTYVSLWRFYIFPLVSIRKSVPAILVGTGTVANDILDEVNGNTRYAIRFSHFYDTDKAPLSGAELAQLLKIHAASVVVLPAAILKDAVFAKEWNQFARSNIRFIDQARLFEELFDRVALDLIDERMFLSDTSGTDGKLYGPLKRSIDIAVSLLALIVLSPLFLIVSLVLKIGEGRNALIFQTRVGRGNTLIQLIKFRTMLYDDAGDPEKQKQNRVTRFGGFLRRTVIDELPQFWNVLVGDLSLVGPRPEIPTLVAEYEREIPFYTARHSIQPGMSGWAQVKHASPPKWRLDVEATKKKLSYDLYYMKHRSLQLDFVVALRTIQILLSRGG